MIFTRLFFLSVFFFRYLCFYSQAVPVKFQGEVSDDRGNLGGVHIDISRGGKVENTIVTDEGGKYGFDLPLGGDYLVTVSKEGYITKKFTVNTNGVPPEKAATKFPIIQASLGLSKKMEGIDYSALNQPINKYKYNPQLDNFEYDEAYLNQMISKLTAIKEAEKEQLKKEKAKEAEYAAAVKQGDKLYSNRDWEGALDSYKQAQGIKPNEEHPTTQINAINKILSEAAAKQAAADASAKAKADADAALKKAAADAAAKKAADDAASKAKIAAELAAKKAADDAAAKKLADEAAAKTKAEKDAAAKKAADEAAAKAKADAEMAAKSQAEKDAAAKKAADEAAAKAKADADAAAKKAAETAAAKKIADEAAAKAKAADDAAAKKAAEEAAAKSKLEKEAADKSAKEKAKAEAEALAKAQAEEAAAKAKAEKENADRLAKEKLFEETKYKEALKRADDFFTAKRYKDAKKNYEEALTFKGGDAYAKGRLVECEKLLNSDDNQKTDERVKQLLAKYNPGITEEVINAANVVIIQRVVVKDNNAWVFQKKIFNWGGTAYFRDGNPITESSFESETKP